MTASTGVAPYADNAEYLRDELRRLDLLIRLRVDAVQGRLHPESQVERSVYICDDEVDRLLGQDDEPATPGREGPRVRAALDELSGRIAARLEQSVHAGLDLGLPRLGAALGLSAFELQALVIALAPELRRRYDRIFAYLQDDITRQRPSVDLVLELLCAQEDERWRARRLLGPAGTLRRTGVLEPVADPASPSGSSGLAQFLRLDPRILGFLLGDDHLDERLDGRARLESPPYGAREPDVEPALVARTLNLLEARIGPDGGNRRPIIHLYGPPGVGKRELAGHLCARLGVAMLVVDVAGLVSGSPEEGATLIRLALREGLLRGCAVYLAGVEALLQDRARPTLVAFAGAVAEHGPLVFSAGSSRWWDEHDVDAGPVTSVEVPEAPLQVRVKVWCRELAGHHPDARDWAEVLASRYRFVPGQIRAAVEIAQARVLMRSDGRGMTFDDVSAACREQSNHRLAEVAIKVEPRYGWDDLVLPADRTALLREICDQVRHHSRVYVDWGFGRKLGHGRGLSALFSGPPGTGKTLAAQVVARDVGLDLYRVDLSRVVSKYIGETEKNLARIFEEAQTGNAILFFDEADALFGKRTEVSDAHDRYANIETSYLLQRMEDYDGVVILATNMRANLDDAFARRIRFLVDFPFPDEAHRLRIWRTHFPADAPVSPEVDCDLLARAITIAGGGIKNIVLNAAFLAASDGGVIGPDHLLQGGRREFDKVGKVWSDPR